MSILVESSPVAMGMTSRDRTSLTGASPSKQQRLDDETCHLDTNLNPPSYPDLSRSPSMGETFVSADGPLSSSEEDDDSSDDDEDVLRTRDPVRSPSLNSATAMPMEGRSEIRPMSPGEGPSGSTSISVSMGSNGDESGERSLSEPSILVTIVPEKKGIFLKHSEYEIKSKAYDTEVKRRYKDFVTLHSYLVQKYPYRLIPSLPPKQLMVDSLLEERRRGLQTWLAIIAMHPVLGSSPMLVTFLSDKTPDHLFRMRVAFEKQVDEFSRLRTDVDLPLEDQEKLAASRDRLRKVLHSLHRLRKIFDEQAFRLEQQARDMAEVDLILQGLEVREVFGEKTFDEMSNSAQAVSKHSDRYVQLQRNAINERIHVLMELLAAHNELCDRVEKGIFAEYQKALSKSLNISKIKMKSVIRGSGPDNVSTLAQREVAQCGEADALGRRCAFALHCVRSESSLAEKYLQSLPAILLAYASEESQYHSKMSKIWHRLVVSESSKLC
ncbi:sorting nexin-8 isoform X2 [Culex quinquefasciatus]|uniref:sorting nexin-8 isoform X2 n=1 Tax=Culex quinquefasciatus TaxID=7176 RepID=UPI0018E3BFE5|nr:sorting nexin-8 isoform X2 [Culex quinquefasciatus]